ncbi:hypothetical protein [Chitinophaga sp. MM2321]|uniref:hypothetical protein n=1 Tax=Chitinophaga sp. MM2321 TaxID=3137178 RepID=UPI0032D59E63
MKLFFTGLCLLSFMQTGGNPSLNISTVTEPPGAGMLSDNSRYEAPGGSMAKCMDQAWKVSWERFFLPGTQMFYDYLSSYEPGRGLDHLPKTEEVKKQFPNVYGYDTGMEDCMISAGVMLSMIVDQYSVTRNVKLRKNAFSVFKGIQLSASVEDAPGFLARCVCAEDRKSVYINSSRDQYTHAVHGLWKYYNSPLCTKEVKIEIGKVLSAFADRMTRNVTAANDYDFLRADGARDTRGISRMWHVGAHEAARLPMIYAAAWNTTGNKEYFESYRHYVKDAIDQSFDIAKNTTTYGLLQMQCSMELLGSLEQDTDLKVKIRQIEEKVSGLCAGRAENADDRARNLDLTMVGTDWRTGEGLKPKGEYRKVWYCIRESGEAALTQLMSEKTAYPESQQQLLTRAIKRLDYQKVSSNGIFYLQAAYWKARQTGIFTKSD